MAGYIRLESSEAQITFQARASMILGHVLTSTEKNDCSAPVNVKTKRRSQRLGKAGEWRSAFTWR